eukprot:scaffold59863_cov69-Phaeocystis_antarctica.AAC.2
MDHFSTMNIAGSWSITSECDGLISSSSHEALPQRNTYTVSARAGEMSWKHIKSERTSIEGTSFRYTLVLVRVAVPLMQSPPPSCQPWARVTFQRGAG